MDDGTSSPQPRPHARLTLSTPPELNFDSNEETLAVIAFNDACARANSGMFFYLAEPHQKLYPSDAKALRFKSVVPRLLYVQYSWDPQETVAYIGKNEAERWQATQGKITDLDTMDIVPINLVLITQYIKSISWPTFTLAELAIYGKGAAWYKLSPMIEWMHKASLDETGQIYSIEFLQHSDTYCKPHPSQKKKTYDNSVKSLGRTCDINGILDGIQDSLSSSNSGSNYAWPMARLIPGSEIMEALAEEEEARNKQAEEIRKEEEAEAEAGGGLKQKRAEKAHKQAQLREAKRQERAIEQRKREAKVQEHEAERQEQKNQRQKRLRETYRLVEEAKLREREAKELEREAKEREREAKERELEAKWRKKESQRQERERESLQLAEEAKQRERRQANWQAYEAKMQEYGIRLQEHEARKRECQARRKEYEAQQEQQEHEAQQQEHEDAAKAYPYGLGAKRTRESGRTVSDQYTIIRRQDENLKPLLIKKDGKQKEKDRELIIID